MYRLIAVGLLALLLGACEGQNGSDGYRFGAAEYERDRIAVTIVQHDDRAAFLASARLHKVKTAEGSSLQAFTLISPDKPKCEIHIQRIATHYRPQWLGHELAHCIHGRWHP